MALTYWGDVVTDHTLRPFRHHPPERTCPTCDGTGKLLIFVRHDPPGYCPSPFDDQCPVCGGTGKVPAPTGTATAGGEDGG